MGEDPLYVLAIRINAGEELTLGSQRLYHGVVLEE